MARFKPAIGLLLLTLSACATVPDISQSRSPCRNEAGGWCAFVRDAAVDAYPYAITATNAYFGDDDLFQDLGRNLRRIERLEIAEEDAEKGFDYQIFEKLLPAKSAGKRKLEARVLAFRGTDFNGLSDIFYGTLRDDQIDLAIRYFEAEQARFDDGVPWVVTGHSLGGALATEVSIKHPEVRAYMFNTSPFYESDAMTNDVRRIVFNERGEVLRRFARYDISPAAEAYTINCGPRKSTFSKHKVRPLADCLLWIAAYGDKEAAALVKANGVAKPMVECGEADKPHPGTGYRQVEPCVHQARKPRR